MYFFAKNIYSPNKLTFKQKKIIQSQNCITLSFEILFSSNHHNKKYTKISVVYDEKLSVRTLISLPPKRQKVRSRVTKLRPIDAEKKADSNIVHKSSSQKMSLIPFWP